MRIISGETEQLESPYDARAVANLLLDLADARRLPLTQMAVLKIIYFAHGWYLAAFDAPLILQDFEAWKYGPVVKVVRDEFKRFGDRAITERARKFDLLTAKYEEVKPHLASRDVIFVKGVFESYHVFDAWQLSALTHEAGSPWDRLWNSSEPVGRMALRIRNNDIKEHFGRLAKRLSVA